MKFRYLLVFLATSSGLLEQKVHAETFECAFLQEKYAGGKSNNASCSMLPEKVYSTKWLARKKSEHCNIEQIHEYADIKQVVINTKKGTVNWKINSGLTEDGKSLLKKNFISQGYSEEEANRKIVPETIKAESFQIKSHLISKQKIFIDEITGEALFPPKEEPEHHLMFTDGYSMYNLYIPEFSGHAILLKPSGMADASWVNIRFGKCRLNP